jgi:hypothetical protein
VDKEIRDSAQVIEEDIQDQEEEQGNLRPETSLSLRVDAEDQNQSGTRAESPTAATLHKQQAAWLHMQTMRMLS